MQWMSCLVTLWLVCLSAGRQSTSDVHKTHAGHLQPFGSCGPFQMVDVMQGFPSTVDFFRQYVQPLRPLKMIGAAELSSAFHKWTDGYFLQTAVSVNITVAVETGKKENRSRPLQHLHFHEFLRLYNSTEQYMVDNIPREFRADVLLPGPLQCPHIYSEMLIDAVMWMSSGGTSSVVHTDSVDNIICVYRGQKNFIMVDPSLYADKVIIDHPEGAYSSIDVDRVDYASYPGLASVEYHRVRVSAGDCLYIPYKWIHQVRSYGNNIAVNVWWRHTDNSEDVVDRCATVWSDDLTLDQVMLHSTQSLSEWFESILHTEVNLEEFINVFIQDVDNDSKVSLTLADYRRPLYQMFLIMDKNADSRVTPDELQLLTAEEWLKVEQLVSEFDECLRPTIRSDYVTSVKTEL